MTSQLDLFPLTAEVRNNHLFIGGCDVAVLAEEFGTPLYIFDEFTLRTKCAEFKREFGTRYSDTLVIYACKAFISRPWLRILAEEGLGLDVVSGGELTVAAAAGFPMERVYFHGNNKSREELELALNLGVGRIVVDNFYELELLEEAAREKGKVQPVLLRVTPGIDPHTHSYIATGVADSKFGFPLPHVTTAAERALRCPHIKPVGLHFHLGSSIYETEPYQRAIPLVLGLARELRQKLGFPLEELSPGGGFAVTYTREKAAPPISYYARDIVAALLNNLGDLDPPRLILEPGRAIVGQAGVAVYRVGAIKEVPGVRLYACVDGGMGDNIRPALYGASYEALVANRAGEPPLQKVTIAGKFCESGDILIRDVELPRLSPGDLIAVPVCGAYSIPMSSNYNAVPRPAIVAVADGIPRLWRRRETYHDLLAYDIE